MAQVKTKHITFQCSCDGTVPPTNIYLTSDYNLLVEGLCLECGSKIHVSIPLESLITDCPTTGPAPKGIASVDPDRFDAEFLKDMKISFGGPDGAR